VCGTESRSSATAELTWGLIIAVARNLVGEARSVREGGWQVGLGMELRGKTLGVLGLGRQGSAVAAIGKAFGMDVVAWSENLTAERCAECGVRRMSSMEQLLAESHVVSIHLVLSDRTRGLIGRDELAQMKTGAILVNTSRGAIVEEEALVDAVQSGAIAGAGVDVFAIEPLPRDHVLRRTPGILATPHLGYVTRENYEDFYTQAIEDVTAWLDGSPIRVLNSTNG
jgi:phosphoglycerate dehydrogenase-like enzyme